MRDLGGSSLDGLARRRSSVALSPDESPTMGSVDHTHDLHRSHLSDRSRDEVRQSVLLDRSPDPPTDGLCIHRAKPRPHTTSGADHRRTARGLAAHECNESDRIFRPLTLNEGVQSLQDVGVSVGTGSAMDRELMRGVGGA